jgi:hypothetical protein
MLRLPLVRRALVAATAGSAVVVAVVLLPSAAWAESPNPEACSGLYHGNPPGSLVMTTSPGSGTVLHPGDEVEVTATWDTADWPRPDLHKVLDCLLVDGDVDYDHSSQEKPTDNDGYYRYRFTVPSGARGRVCDRVRLSGRFVEGGDLVVQKSNTVCFSIAAVAGDTGDTGAPGSPTAPSGPPEAGEVHLPPASLAPADEGSPAPVQPLGPAAGPPAPDGAAPEGAAPEGAAPAPPAAEISAVSLPMLPRTGADPLPLAELGALLILLGGAALAARRAVPGPCPRP